MRRVRLSACLTRRGEVLNVQLLVLLLTAIGFWWVAACSGSNDKQVKALPTYANDYFTGNQVCAGILVGRLRVLIPADGVPAGESVPPNPARPPKKLIWPVAYALERGAAGIEVHGPGDVRIQDGAVLENVDACVGANDTLFIVDIDRVVSP